VPDSKVDDKYAKPVVGGQVKVEGVKVDGKLIVYEMEAGPPPKQILIVGRDYEALEGHLGPVAAGRHGGAGFRRKSWSRAGGDEND
jgi:hypothetical protein